LDSICSECQSCHKSSSIHDSSSRYNRNVDGIYYLRNQRHTSDIRPIWKLFNIERATMTACFTSLRNNDINSSFFGYDRFFHHGRHRNQCYSSLFCTLNILFWQYTESSTDDGNFFFETDSYLLVKHIFIFVTGSWLNTEPFSYRIQYPLNFLQPFELIRLLSNEQIYRKWTISFGFH